MKRYLLDSRIIHLRNPKVDLEYIDHAYTRLLSVKNEVTEDLRQLAISAGQDPGGYVNSWFDNADAIIVARKERENVGFAILSYHSDNILFFPATMVAKEMQANGLSKFMNFYLLKRYFFWRIKQTGKFLPDFNIAFRTQNPVLYATWKKYLKIYPPMLEKQVIPKHIADLGEKFVEKMWPGSVFDKETFIIHNAYLSSPGLRVDPKNLSLSKDPRVNHFFDERLGISRGSKDALLILGEIRKIFKFYLLLFKRRIT